MNNPVTKRDVVRWSGYLLILLDAWSGWLVAGTEYLTLGYSMVLIVLLLIGCALVFAGRKNQ